MDAPATHQLVPQPSVPHPELPSRLTPALAAKAVGGRGWPGFGQRAGVSVAVRGGGGGRTERPSAPAGRRRGLRPPALPHSVRRQRPQAPRLTLRLVGALKRNVHRVQPASLPNIQNFAN